MPYFCRERRCQNLPFEEGRSGRDGKARRTGPPIAPRRTASAFLAAARASSVRGEPVASIEAWTFNVSRETMAGGALNERSVTYPAQQVFLEVELDLRSFFLYYAEDLDCLL